MDHEVEGAPNNRLGEVILGIDLGDSFSRVAVWHNGSVQLVPLDAEGNKEIPSCVAFRESNGREEVLVGRPALEQLAKGGAIHRVRRVLGQVDIADKSLVSGARFWPFMVQSMGIQGERPVIGIKKGEDWVSIAPEEVVTLILQHLKGMAEKFLGHSVTEAILTGPAGYDRVQCRILAEAAERAGICARKIVAEPSLAGLWYAHRMKPPSRKRSAKEMEDGHLNYQRRTGLKILIFHLDSGFCSASTIVIEDHVCEDLSIEGAPFGTDDFVSNLVEYVLANPSSVNLPANPDRQMLWEAYRAATERLCHSQTTQVEGLGGFTAELTRAHFEDVNAPLFERCLEMATRCIAYARFVIDDVLVLGEAGRIPRLKELLVHRFAPAGRKPIHMLRALHNGDWVVRGAALNAAIMSRKEVGGDMLLLQVNKHDLRIKVRGDLLVPILPRFWTIPTQREIAFTTCTDNQEQAIIQLYEGERAITRHNVLLGYIRVGPLPPAPAGVPQIMVQVTVAADDALTVRVRVPKLFEGAVKVPDPVIFKMPSASFSHTWCAEALHTKYNTSTDIQLPRGTRWSGFQVFTGGRQASRG